MIAYRDFAPQFSKPMGLAERARHDCSRASLLVPCGPVIQKEMGLQLEHFSGWIAAFEPVRH